MVMGLDRLFMMLQLIDRKYDRLTAAYARTRPDLAAQYGRERRKFRQRVLDLLYPE